MVTTAWDKYSSSGRDCLHLICEDGEPFTTATINVQGADGADLEPGEVVIKDYSENAGCLKSLLDAGIVERTGKFISTGFCDCEIVKVLRRD